MKENVIFVRAEASTFTFSNLSGDNQCLWGLSDGSRSRVIYLSLYNTGLHNEMKAWTSYLLHKHMNIVIYIHTIAVKILHTLVKNMYIIAVFSYNIFYNNESSVMNL